jgi:hypothetical protein
VVQIAKKRETAAKIKPAPFQVVVFIEFPVLVAVSILGDPNSN